ncbi:MAG: hydroxymethylglutaryl-CoA lyase [Phycisphaerae bacterium]|nr:3-hydroxy-3-isohexenylglutaryl-CoA/hydroxy-methylglutaryl-CoA lyase [Phycisphaerales bacterium]
MAGTVRITDVSPRDGLQNEEGAIATSEKVRLVKLLCAADVDEVEVSSFVSSRWVPQLGDAAEVFAALADDASLRERRPVFSALVPNEKGMNAALEVNQRAARRLLDKVSVFTAASETFSRRNTNASIDETVERFRPVVAAGRRHGLAVRAYISCAIACPFEGPVQPAAVARVVEKLATLRDQGDIAEIDLGDTIGAGTPESIRAMLDAVLTTAAAHLPSAAITLHLHDTFGRAASCVVEALTMGIRSFDGAAGGLGGCPYASTSTAKAPGNIATELLVSTIRDAGFTTTVSGERLAEAGSFARSLKTS